MWDLELEWGEGKEEGEEGEGMKREEETEGMEEKVEEEGNRKKTGKLGKTGESYVLEWNGIWKAPLKKNLTNARYPLGHIRAEWEFEDQAHVQKLNLIILCLQQNTRKGNLFLFF